MTLKNFKLYHLFFVLAILNFLKFYLIFGKSVLDIHETDMDFWIDKMFNYYISVSLLILLIWFSYWKVNKKLTSRKLTWLHLFITFTTLFIIPEIVVRFFDLMPRRYLDYGGGLQLPDFFGSMTLIFLGVGIILLTSELLLIANIRQQPKKTILEICDGDS